MTKFKLTLKETRVHVYELEVEADSREQALEIGAGEDDWDEVDDYYTDTLSMDAEELED